MGSDGSRCRIFIGDYVILYYFTGSWSNGMMSLSLSEGTEFDSPRAHIILQSVLYRQLYKPVILIVIREVCVEIF